MFSIMKTFAIDTSTNSATAAIVEDGNVIGCFTVCMNKPHSQKIMPVAEMLFKQTELMPKDIDLFAAAEGPGSFTGLRIGIAAGLGLSDAVEKPCVGVSTLRSLNFPYEKYNKYVCPLIDAKRDRAYFALYKGRKTIIEPDSKPITEILSILDRYDESVLLTGDFVQSHEDLLNAYNSGKYIIEERSKCISDAVNVAVLAERIYRRGDYGRITPKYVLKSYVEELPK